ncbi:MAG TPA: valine--tRNA ligase [Micromonosporaceae bacterium]|nr:valine--tRNA ligase [Micromonosporaceae bacterium]
MPEISPDPSTGRDIASQYEPRRVEDVLYRRWVDRGYFTADAASEKPPFSLVIPPPNVTGSLHLGHALEQTLMDAVLRRRRMLGDEVLWLPGMDHAGIATQVLVEKHLAETEGKTRHDVGREDFVARVWRWKEEYGGKILGQMRRLGVGVDWSRERFTMDDGLSKAVQTIFKRLYEDGLIYRAERIINWCPTDHTALSDIEVDHADDEGELVSIRYGDGDRSVVVATTRVETMLGDTAVAVHPDDPRYAHLIGTEIELPLVGRMIPVVADAHVDPEFGTGAVKVTPAHDPNDFEIGQRHSLPMVNIMDEAARITAHGPFEGLSREDARHAVTAALREEGRIVAEKRPYVHAVGHCSRCDTVVEPRLSLQWFVRVEKLAKAAGDAVRDGRVTIEPPALKPRYFDWVDNMHDWCISRQLWWGHRIPVWYGPNGETLCVGPNDTPPAGDGWTQDPDVLDTWFSSALWPFSTMGWPARTADLSRFYPTSLLVTGYDILFFWVVRIMLFGLYAMDGEVPFRTVLLHGLVRDKYGKKMSKSRGNTVDPLDWMDSYGSDALRFSLARGANPGLDQPANEEWVAAARNSCNKMWNATRFAILNGATVEGDLPTELGPVDRWICSRLDEVTAEVDGYLASYEFAKATATLYHFVWDEFCDWYLELAKVSLTSGDDAAAATTRRVLGEVLDVSLRLLHPFVPFVTETLWTTLTGGESLVVAPWPQATGQRRDAAAEAEVAALQSVVTEVRRFRSDQGLRPGQRVPARLSGLDAAGVAPHEPAIRVLARLEAPTDGFAPTATLGIANGVTVELDLSGTLDVAAETARLGRDLATAEKERAQTEAKLGNADFLAKAPDHVVANIRDRAAIASAEIERITAQLAALRSRA